MARAAASGSDPTRPVAGSPPIHGARWPLRHQLGAGALALTIALSAFAGFGKFAHADVSRAAPPIDDLIAGIARHMGQSADDTARLLRSTAQRIDQPYRKFVRQMSRSVRRATRTRDAITTIIAEYEWTERVVQNVLTDTLCEVAVYYFTNYELPTEQQTLEFAAKALAQEGVPISAAVQQSAMAIARDAESATLQDQTYPFLLAGACKAYGWYRDIE
jgi:hypothetical protein